MPGAAAGHLPLRDTDTKVLFQRWHLLWEVFELGFNTENGAAILHEWCGHSRVHPALGLRGPQLGDQWLLLEGGRAAGMSRPHHPGATGSVRSLLPSSFQEASRRHLIRRHLIGQPAIYSFIQHHMYWVQPWGTAVGQTDKDCALRELIFREERTIKEDLGYNNNIIAMRIQLHCAPEAV